MRIFKAFISIISATSILINNKNYLKYECPNHTCTSLVRWDGCIEMILYISYSAINIMPHLSHILRIVHLTSFVKLSWTSQWQTADDAFRRQIMQLLRREWTIALDPHCDGRFPIHRCLRVNVSCFMSNKAHFNCSKLQWVPPDDFIIYWCCVSVG